jgi:hypothetical protein
LIKLPIGRNRYCEIWSAFQHRKWNDTNQLHPWTGITHVQWPSMWLLHQWSGFLGGQSIFVWCFLNKSLVKNFDSAWRYKSSYITTEGQSASLSWCQALISDPWPIFSFFL